MSYETRLTLNYTFGTLSAAVGPGDVTLTSPDFVGLPELSTIIYLPITLQDPSLKVHEIVWARSHLTGATTVVTVRAQEGTAARSWPAGTLWTIAPTVRDGLSVVANQAALPATPHGGCRCYLQDEQRIVEFVVGVGWVGSAPTGYRVARSLTATTANVTFSAIPSTLKKLVVHWSARTTHPVVFDALGMRVNGVTNAYFSSLFWQTGGTLSGSVEWIGVNAHCGFMTGTQASAANWGAGEVVIPGWNNPGGRGAVQYFARSHLINSQTDAFRAHNAGMCGLAGPYTSLVFLPANGSFTAGTEFVLYGYF